MRSYSSRVVIASLLFILVHAFTIPLMSAYGLQVCPILHGLGFWEGCNYLTIQTSATLGFTGVLLWATPNLTPFRGTLLYILASVLAAAFGALLFNQENLILTSRVPEIMGLIALLLGIMLAYLLRWVGVTKKDIVHDFHTAWWRSVIAGLTPALAIAVFNTHYIFRLTEFDPDDTFLTLLSVTSWMVITYTIHFRTEHRRAMIFGFGLEGLKRGDLTTRVPPFSGGLWAPLGKLLNEALVALQERGRLLHGMSRFVSREVAEKVRHGELEFSGNSVTMAVLMMDLRDFTAVSQNLSNEKLVQFLNIYFEETLQIFIRHNVVVDKFIGDGVLAYVEQKDTSGVQNAFNAAQEMLRELPRINRQLKENDLPEIKVGIGITQGDVVLGNIGGKERWQYTIVGKTVNRAARLEALTKKVQSPLVVDQLAWESLNTETKKWLVEKGSHPLAGLDGEFKIYGL